MLVRSIHDPRASFFPAACRQADGTPAVSSRSALLGPPHRRVFRVPARSWQSWYLEAGEAPLLVPLKDATVKPGLALLGLRTARGCPRNPPARRDDVPHRLASRERKTRPGSSQGARRRREHPGRLAASVRFDSASRSKRPLAVANGASRWRAPSLARTARGRRRSSDASASASVPCMARSRSARRPSPPLPHGADGGC